MRCLVASCVAVVLVCIGLQFGSAQEREERQPRADRQPLATDQARPGAAGNIESKLAPWLASCNNLEIEVSQLALQKASDPEVKRFAQQMIDEHGEFNSKLAQFIPASERGFLKTGTGAAERTGAAGRTETRDETTQRRTDAPAGGQTARRETAGGHDEIMEIGKEAAQKKSQMILALLGEKEGQEFDMCFMGLQVFAHVGAVAELEAMQDQGSEQFQQVVTTAAQTTKTHLEHAKKLAQKVGQSSGAERVTRRPDQQTEREQPQDRP